MLKIKRHLNETRRQDIRLIYNYFKKCVFRRVAVSEDMLCRKLAKAFKVSKTTVKNVLTKGVISKERKFPNRQKLDGFDKEVIRRTVHNFYREKMIPTSTILLRKLEDHDIFVSKFLLYKTLHELGFVWAKVKENRKSFAERYDIVTSRANYLQKVKYYRELGYKIVYLDETWVNKNHCLSKAWLPKAAESDILDLLKDRHLVLPNLPSGKGQRLIILHAGCAEQGFIPGCALVFQGKDVDGDYHREMNSKLFLDWFENTLLPSLEGPSLIVLDNASYHNVWVESSKCPTSNNTKQQIIDWLSSKNIKFNPTSTKVQLYELIKRNKPPIRYITDELAEYSGHKVLRTPVRHCELNPIELIWATIKYFVAKRNNTFRMANVKALVLQAIESVTANDWDKAVQHTMEIEKKFWEVDSVIGDIEPVIIDLENHESDDEDFTDDDSDDE